MQRVAEWLVCSVDNWCGVQQSAWLVCSVNSRKLVFGSLPSGVFDETELIANILRCGINVFSLLKPTPTQLLYYNGEKSMHSLLYNYALKYLKMILNFSVFL